MGDLHRARRKCLIVLWAGLVAVPAAAAAESAKIPAPHVGFDCTLASVGGAKAMFGDVTSAIARKWNLGAASPEALESQVTVRVCFSAAGRADQIILIAADGPNDEAVQGLFHAARRAILRADSDGGLPLPLDRFDSWRVLDLVFDANGMRVR
ncbi:hypothetical protein [Tabrizicola sp.]|uniref:hypothetical protein n=1 Tax=Tabrizicola sp. TaxID=2005166 RepID=UPI002735D8DD|nr:hypothetical protein [Tabrizicola sp.]